MTQRISAFVGTAAIAAATVLGFALPVPATPPDAADDPDRPWADALESAEEPDPA